MNDLISRKAVIEVIESLCSNGNMYGNENLTLIDAYAAINKITEIEVAYDVDKVVEQLEEQTEELVNYYMTSTVSDIAEEFINIIKRGGQ